MGCIFCDIAAKKSPADVFYEDEHTIVFADILPRTRIHLLITPKQHFTKLTELPEETILRLINTAKLIAEKLGITHNFRLQLNNGADAGQIIDHLHFHFMSNESGVDVNFLP
jgi:histidine triad (HIT) family protein